MYAGGSFWGGAEIQQGVIRGEIMPMVDANKMIEVAVLEEWPAIPIVS
jgi:hypothetical protein